MLFAFFAPVFMQAQELPASGRPFNPHYIIDDIEYENADGLSLAAIQNFLRAQTGTLATYRAVDGTGIERSASEIIYNAAQQHRINPKVLLVLLQKEQSLIEDVAPSQRQYDWATGYAVCDSCRTDDPALAPFKGFATQVERAAARQRYYFDHPEEFAIRVGRERLINGVMVTPVNQATANLYIYTPHIHGNQLFWNLWQRYFARHYPDGAVLADALTGDVWLLQHGQRRLFVSRSVVYADYSERQIIKVPHIDLQRYDIGVPIRFPAYSLLRSPRGTVYLLVGDEKRGIVSREIFRRIGFNPEEVIDATWDDLAAYPEGAPIATAEGNPLGELWQNKSTGGVYYVAKGVRHPIWSREILQNRYAHFPLKSTPSAALAALPTGEPVGFKDGSLVVGVSSPVVYVISNGQKRPIVSEDVFTQLGYRWDTIIQTSPRALEAHPDGLPIVS